VSAQWSGDRSVEPAPQLKKMTIATLDGVMAIEQLAYEFPWTRGNFIDALAAGYDARLLCRGDQVIGYFVVMAGVDEMHLLNLTVAPAEHGQGHGRFMLDEVVALCAREAAQKLWLEVRGSNTRARAIYRRFGFTEIGLRKGYYPAPNSRREDAIVMGLTVPEARDGLE
jgi:[ribosomal protein S18]-alanine N-acetyltransferase